MLILFEVKDTIKQSECEALIVNLTQHVFGNYIGSILLNLSIRKLNIINGRVKYGSIMKGPKFLAIMADSYSTNHLHSQLVSLGG